MKKLLCLTLMCATPLFAERTLEVNRDEPRVNGANEAAGSKEITRIANENRDVVGAVAGNAIAGGGMKGLVGGAIGAIIARDPNRPK